MISGFLTAAGILGMGMLVHGLHIPDGERVRSIGSTWLGIAVVGSVAWHFLG